MWNDSYIGTLNVYFTHRTAIKSVNDSGYYIYHQLTYYSSSVLFSIWTYISLVFSKVKTDYLPNFNYVVRFGKGDAVCFLWHKKIRVLSPFWINYRIKRVKSIICFFFCKDDVVFLNFTLFRTKYMNWYKVIKLTTSDN